MTPPDTDLRTQSRRHWAPLAGMILAVLVGVGIIFYWLTEEVAEAPVTTQQEQAIQGVETPLAPPVEELDPEPVPPQTPDY